MQNFESLQAKSSKTSSPKNERLFVFEGKNDFLLIAIVFLLISFFLIGGFFFK